MNEAVSLLEALQLFKLNIILQDHLARRRWKLEWKLVREYEVKGTFKCTSCSTSFGNNVFAFVNGRDTRDRKVWNECTIV